MCIHLLIHSWEPHLSGKAVKQIGGCKTPLPHTHTAIHWLYIAIGLPLGLLSSANIVVFQGGQKLEDGMKKISACASSWHTHACMHTGTYAGNVLFRYFYIRLWAHRVLLLKMGHPPRCNMCTQMWPEPFPKYRQPWLTATRRQKYLSEKASCIVFSTCPLTNIQVYK